MSTLMYYQSKLNSAICQNYTQNIAFYEQLSLEDYYCHAQINGLDTCEDVFQLYPYIFKANSFLEVGAGFGRVAEALGHLRPDAEVNALEMCGHMCDYLEKKSANLLNVEVIKGDFLDFSGVREYDMITFLWSTLTVFSAEMQLTCLKKCKALLSFEGIVVVDLCDVSSALSLISENHNPQLDEKFESCSQSQAKYKFDRICDSAGFQVKEIIPYFANDTSRYLFVLEVKS